MTEGEENIQVSLKTKDKPCRMWKHRPESPANPELEQGYESPSSTLWIVICYSHLSGCPSCLLEIFFFVSKINHEYGQSEGNERIWHILLLEIIFEYSSEIERVWYWEHYSRKMRRKAEVEPWTRSNIILNLKNKCVFFSQRSLFQSLTTVRWRTSS